jgi:DNA polymerase III epsilon subunit-like protein
MNSTLNDFRAMVRGNKYVILDTETTGLQTGEVCQIAIVDAQGKTLVDTLVKPIERIPASATAIHGITNTMVTAAPTWKDVSPLIKDIVSGQHVIAYNAVFDRKMMHKSAEAAGIPKTDWKSFSTWWCAMVAFSEIFGQRGGRSGFRWQSLATAARYYHVPVEAQHTALADCQTTLAVVRAMAGL